MKYSNEEIKSFLLKLSEEIDPSGFNQFAFESRTGKWHFGYILPYKQPSKKVKMVLRKKAVIAIMKTSNLVFERA